jgi:hypothetical protein
MLKSIIKNRQRPTPSESLPSHHSLSPFHFTEGYITSNVEAEKLNTPINNKSSFTLAI